MTYGGWITFILSVGSFTALFGWCLYKVITCKPPVVDADVADNPRNVAKKPQKRAKLLKKLKLKMKFLKKLRRASVWLKRELFRLKVNLAKDIRFSHPLRICLNLQITPDNS